MSGNMFFNEEEKNKLMSLIINTDYENEDNVWDLALSLEHYSIVLRTNVLKQCKE